MQRKNENEEGRKRKVIKDESGKRETPGHLPSSGNVLRLAHRSRSGEKNKNDGTTRRNRERWVHSEDQQGKKKREDVGKCHKNQAPLADVYNGKKRNGCP